MLFDDTYKTIKSSTNSVFRDRGSKFIGFAYPVTSQNDHKGILTQIKVLHPKANHYCWAFRLGTDSSVYRLNDDGEPPGTAGRPILNTLLSFDVTNILVIVVRYFGGTLLGVPGLINAYKVTTEDALKQAVIITKTANDVYTVAFDYLQMNTVMGIIKDENLLILDQQFDNVCTIQVAIRKTLVEIILSKMNNISGVILTYNYSS